MNQEDRFSQIARQMNSSRREAEKAVRPSFCSICGHPFEDGGGICASHSVPQMVLNNIMSKNKDGQMTCSRTFGMYEDDIPIPALPDFIQIQPGKSRAGVFRSICKKCDSEFFKDYEDEEALLSLDPYSAQGNKILSEIMIKSHLAKLAKVKTDYKTERIQATKAAMMGLGIVNLNTDKALELDERDAWLDIVRCEEIIKQGLSNQFLVPVFRILPYRNQIAAQIVLPITYDLKGNRLTDTLSFDAQYKLDDFCIVSFPLKRNTLLMMFCLKDSEKTYGEYVSQISGLNVSNQMKLMQALMFSGSEDIFMTNEIAEKMEKDLRFRKIVTHNLSSALFGKRIGDTNLRIQTTETNTGDYESQRNYLSIQSKL